MSASDDAPPSGAADSGALVDQVRRRHRRTLLTASAMLVGAGVVGGGAVLLTAFDLDAAVQRPAEVRWRLTEGVGFIAWGKAALLSEAGKVEARAPGHAPGEAQLHREGARRVRIELEPLPGKVQIHLDMEQDLERTLTVNGRTVDEAGGALPLPRGIAKAAVAGPLLKPLQADLDIIGFGEAQEFTLRPQAAGSLLQASVAPADASILLDGAPWGVGERVAAVPLGRHKVSAELAGYFSESADFEAAPDSTASFEWRLRPRPATLDITTSPTGAAILLNGEYAGAAPISLTAPALTTHSLTARLADHQDVDIHVRPGPGERIRRTLSLDGRRIQLLAQASAAAAIKVNGVKTGEAPMQLALSIGDRVEADAAGLLAAPLVVSSEGGDSRQWMFQLLPPRAHAHRQAPQREEPAPGVALIKMPMEGLHPAITRPFMIGESEVTHQAYAQFAATDMPAGAGADHPITGVSWRDAAKFCNWLSEQANLPEAYAFDDDGYLIGLNTASLGYRLPTELEWEAAAGRLKPAGASAAPFANLAGRERGDDRHLPDYVDGHRSTAPATWLPVSPLGLKGMAGNVSEWVNDYYADRPGVWPNDYAGPPDGYDHVVKGASFLTFDWRDVDAKRRSFVTRGAEDVGFRVARWLH